MGEPDKKTRYGKAVKSEGEDVLSGHSEILA